MKLAHDVAKQLEARLTLRILDMEAFNKKVPTLKRYAEEWFQLPHKMNRFTLERYKGTMVRHVYPKLGDHQIDQIKRRDLKVFFDRLLKKGMKESSFQLIKSPLSKIFQHAIDDELIQVNPLSGISHSKRRSIDIKPFTEDQAFLFLEAAKDYRKGVYYPHFLTLLRTGVRIGELLGLQWKDIDFKSRELVLKRHIFQTTVMDATKNGQIRTVDMTPHLSETLRALKKEKQINALKFGRPFSEWCFSLGNKVKPMSMPPIRKAMFEILEKAGLPKMRLHDFRHSYATIRLLKGHDIGDVSYQMGHSSIKVTFDIYTHWIPGKFKNQVDDLDMHPNAPKTHPEKMEN
ncbi:site-specific recombinase, phage integrase family [delta proteobacterium NaphS2]|nr:site-specific recombinase, phage integrase family [delta proteobacterium NaphS2]